jgi:hypothetical protein
VCYQFFGVACERFRELQDLFITIHQHRLNDPSVISSRYLIRPLPDVDITVSVTTATAASP